MQLTIVIQLSKEDRAIMTQIADAIVELKNEVTQVIGVQKSAVVALNGIFAKFREVSDVLEEEGADVEALNEVIDELDNSKEELAAAIATNQVPPA